MRFQPKFIAILNVSIFTATLLTGFVACNPNKMINQNEKDISEVQNETRFNEDVTKISDAKFLEETAIINIHSIGLGQLGRDKSQMPEILVLSKALIEDHNAASVALKEMADKKNISLPVSAEKVEDEGISKLVKEKKSTFDKTYLDVVIQYHQEAIKKFEAEDSLSTDIEVKNYIAFVLPSLKKHLAEAVLIQKNN